MPIMQQGDEARGAGHVESFNIKALDHGIIRAPRTKSPLANLRRSSSFGRRILDDYPPNRLQRTWGFQVGDLAAYPGEI
jgi:hypothetical protein